MQAYAIDNQVHSNRIGRTSRMIYFLLVISPILQMYKFIGPVTCGEVMLVVSVLLIQLSNNGDNKIHVDRRIFVILTYFLLSTVLGMIVLNGDATNCFKEYIVFLIYYVIVLMLSNRIEIRAFLDIYRKVAFAMSVLMIFQFVFFQLFHITIPGLIPGLTTYAGANTNDYIYKNLNRCAGFFTEPAMAARFLGIPFIVAILEILKKEKLLSFEIVIFTIALLFSLSGNAIITILVGFAIYVIAAIKRRDMKSALYMIIIMIIFVISAVMLNRTATFSRLFSRVSEVSGNSTMKSGYIRVARGFVAYLNLPTFAKIFGIGFGNYGIIVRDYIYSIVTAETSLVTEWINGIQDYFIYGGAIGGLLFLSFLKQQYKYGDKMQKCILLLFVAYLFIAGMFCEPLWVFFMIIILDKRITERECIE